MTCKGSAWNSNVCLIGLLEGETNNKEGEGIGKEKKTKEENFLEAKKRQIFKKFKKLKFIVLFLFGRPNFKNVTCIPYINPLMWVPFWSSCDGHRGTVRWHNLPNITEQLMEEAERKPALC